MASRWVRPEVRTSLSLSLSLSRFAYGWAFFRAGVPAVRSDGRGRRHLRDAALPEHHRQPRSQVRIYLQPFWPFTRLITARDALRALEQSRSAWFRCSSSSGPVLVVSSLYGSKLARPCMVDVVVSD
jgi:hypothetical protein